MPQLSRFVTVWSGLEAQVAAGRLPGYVAAVRHRGAVEVRAGGCLALGDAEHMRPGTPFRIASVSKPVAGALTLALVEDGVLALDDPVGQWLPELAAPRVLSHPAAELDQTVPAVRAITVRHLLTSTAGFGGIWDGSPLGRAIAERGVGPGAVPPAMGPDEFMHRLGGLPLAAQPGEAWLYHVPAEALGVLLARAAGRPLHELVADRICAPLGLRSTGFWTRDRLPTCYELADGALRPWPMPPEAFTGPPPFEGLAGGLVSTAPEVLAVLAALADGGSPLLAPASVAQLTADALTPHQRARAQEFLGPGRSWGLQVAVDVEPTVPGAAPGRWGWDGGTGTSAWVDPGRDLVAVLLTQRMMSGPADGPAEFWRALYRCL
jgi:CubicO group peptidase (beta-lactamase class C family)